MVDNFDTKSIFVHVSNELETQYTGTYTDSEQIAFIDGEAGKPGKIYTKGKYYGTNNGVADSILANNINWNGISVKDTTFDSNSKTDDVIEAILDLIPSGQEISLDSLNKTITDANISIDKPVVDAEGNPTFDEEGNPITESVDVESFEDLLTYITTSITDLNNRLTTVESKKDLVIWSTYGETGETTETE